MRSRRGVSMIELIVVMSACTVGLTLTGTLLNRAMRLQVDSRARADTERIALRLAQQFRADVHRARTVETNNAAADGKVFLRMAFPGGLNVEYSRTAGTILRLVAGAGEHPSREEFAFPAVNELTIESTGAPQRLILTVIARPRLPSPQDKQLVTMSSVPVSLRVESTVGRDSRFGNAPTGEEAPQ